MRDTDSDGCSDYDELNFADFCDNDANTPVSGTCDVAYYNSDFGYGFDLPVGADLTSFDEDQVALFDATWDPNLGSDLVLFATVVTDIQGLESLSLWDYVDGLNRMLETTLGDEFLIETPITLSSGTPPI